MHLRYLIKAIKAGVAGRAGDTAAYKAAALGTSAYGNLDNTLAALNDPLPDISLDELKAQPSGSFGKTLAQFLERNQIQPLQISPTARAELKDAPVLAIRYPILHDAFHVLLEFDTSLAGELGVWSFVAAQQYSPAFEQAALVGRWFTRLLMPWQWGRLRAYEEKGRRLGRQAICVIEQPLDELWGLPLWEVRERLQLPADL